MHKISCLIAVALLFLAGGATAQEERAIDNFGGVGVRAMGMGGAYAGVADDFTAVYWNPAGLAQIRHREVHVAFLRNSHTSDATLSGTTASDELDNTRFGSLGLVFPYPVYQGSLVFAAGFNRIEDFDWSLHERGEIDTLQTNNTNSHEGGLVALSLAGAVDVSPAVSLGITLDLISGEDNNIQKSEWDDIHDIKDYARLYSQDIFDYTYENTYRATMGIMARYPREDPQIRVGATLSTGPTYKIKYTFTGVSDDYKLTVYDDSSEVVLETETYKSKYKLSLPLEMGLGFSLEPIDGLLLAGSVHLAEWSQSEYEDGVSSGKGAFEDRYKDIARYHLGLEWQVPVVALDLRAGFYTDPLPFVGPRYLSDPSDPESVDPVTNLKIEIDQDRRFVTLGAGLLVDKVIQFDLAWARGHFEQTEGELTEDNTINRLFASVAYRF